MLIFRNACFMRIATVMVTALQLNMVAMGAWANSVRDSAAAAQQLGREVMDGFSQEAAALTLQDVFPELAEPPEELQDVFGRDTDTIDLGVVSQDRLLLEASEEGEAYRLVRQSNTRIAPDLSNDPMFNLADTVRSPEYMGSFKDSFADCSTTPVYEDRTTEAHIPKLRTCERIIKPTGSCDINHEVVVKAMPADLVFIVDNSASMDSIIASLRTSIANLAQILGADNEGDLRLGGVVSRDGQWVTNHIRPTQDVSAFQDWVGSIRTNGGQTSSAPAVDWVISNFDWRQGVEKVVVIIGNVDNAKGDPASTRATMDALGFRGFIFHDNRSVHGLGTHLANTFSAGQLFKMAQFLTVVEDAWNPQSCVNDAIATLEEFCDGSYSVVEGGTEETCVNLSGFDVCPGDPIYEQLREPPLPDVSRLATKVRVSAIECRYNEGDMDCWEDPRGNLHCPRNEGGNENTCETYEKDPACGFVSQNCMDGASGSLGTCYVFNEIWDCGYTVDVPTVVNTGSLIECPGPISCMGSECFDTSNTQSGDFAYAVAMLQVAQFAEHDIDCGESGLDCKVFPGEAMECKKALGGYVDCCEAPSGVNLFDYVNLTVNGLKMASSIEALQRTGSIFAPGYWQGAKAAAGSIGETVLSGNWGNMMDAASAAYDKGFRGAAEGIISEFQTYLMEQAYDTMVEMGAESAANAVFQQGAGANGGIGLSSQAAAVVNVVGFIYTAYVITDLMINIIWECEEKEFELGAKKETRQCTYVGSYCASKTLGACVEKREAYCCYSSVVARIIQEQASSQLGKSFGSAEAPKCEALSVDELAQVNWDEIDLTEWVGMLSMTGNLPTIDTVSIDHLTGTGSGLGNVFEDGERLNTLDRNIQRLNEVNVDEIKRQAEIDAKNKMR